MTEAYDRKYTDRDVRGDESLRDLAEDYVQRYTGDFEPLVDAQEALAKGEELTVAMVRKVLNSMRHDRNWYSKMPVPKRGAEVIPMRPPRASKVPDTIPKQCAEEKGHYRHPWEKTPKPGGPEWRYYWKYECSGVPWEITRKEFRSMAKVKYPLAVSKSGRLIHSIDPDGRHNTVWFGPLHAWGWKSDEHHWLTADAELNVKLRCKHPSWIRNPILLRPEQVDIYLEAQQAIGRTGIERCPHCIAVEESL